MPRLSISSGASISFNVVPDWTLNVTAADLGGNATVVLPGADAGKNRPTAVHVVFFPGTPPAGIAPAALLAGGPTASAPTPGPGLINADVSVDLSVPLPLPVGPVTVVAVGEYAV